MSKVKKLPIKEHRDHDHDHENDHDHGELTQLNDAAFNSLMYRLLCDNKNLRASYERLLSQTMQALLKCIEERDSYTVGHSTRVMEYSLLIGRGAKLKNGDLKNLEMASMFHDIGKIGVPDCVLLKPEKLTPEEQAIIRAHPVKSAEILALIDEFKNAVLGARHHHERVDGTGYPDGLKGQAIPLQSRIIIVADTFDAMTSTRPYRKALSVDAAYAELERCSGTQFDPELVKIFLAEHYKLIKKEQKAA